MDRFKTKVAIVTGAGCVGSGWGNGRAMAVRLAQEGAKVFAVDQDPERLAETLELAGDVQSSIETYACDVTSADSIEKMVQACLDKFGTIDILINNVGGSAAGGPIEMCYCERGIHVGHALDGECASCLCSHEGWRDSTLQSCGCATRAHGHPCEHGGARSASHTHG
jgi:NAD(P)-dependent dehydrogenase (short-subunit alcohol dehydrogenase family)